MKILVLYSLPCKTERKTVFDHLYSFKRYVPEADFHYCNVLTHLPRYLRLVDYEGVIFHYTFLAMRWWQPFVWRRLLRTCRSLAKSRAFKVAIPQDEYAHSEALCVLLKRLEVEGIFTCAWPVDYYTLYPKEKTSLTHFVTTYPGFVDEETEASIRQLAEESSLERENDIGYRARNLPHWLGRFGQQKGAVADAFLAWKEKSDLKMDISTEEKDVFYGNEWVKFLLRCRTAIGCLGGSSLHDPTGTIRERAEIYQKVHPEATFEETERACFSGQDNTLQLFTLSPRHFECAMTRTCQLLVEGDYHGILEKGKHYIEIKRDFSNIDEVLEKVKDRELCRQLAEQTYQDLIASGAYTYRLFAQKVVDLIASQREATAKGAAFAFVSALLSLRARLIWWQRQYFRAGNFIMRAYYYLLRRYYRYVTKSHKEPASWHEAKL